MTFNKMKSSRIRDLVFSDDNNNKKLLEFNRIFLSIRIEFIGTCKPSYVRAYYYSTLFDFNTDNICLITAK